MLALFRSRACRAAIALILLLGLAGCGPAARPAPSAETPEQSAEPVTDGSRRWTGSLDAGEELMRALGLDLSPWLSGPLLAELRLDVDEAGRCTLSGDYSACEKDLRAALSVCMHELQEQEAGLPLNGLALAEKLGADPNDLAAALCDELLPPPFRLNGRLSDDLTQLVWDKGGSCAVVTDNGMLRFTLPGRGEAYLRPVETP